MNKDNLLFLANFNLKTTELGKLHDVTDGSLFIFDKENSTFVEIQDYFQTEGHGAGTEKYVKANVTGNGCIENIYAGKSNINSLIAEYQAKCPTGSAGYLGDLVAGWMSENHYSTDTYTSVHNIMNSDIADEFIATFVQQH